MKHSYINTSSPPKKKIMLIFPPDWFPSEPYLSIPTLTAVLRQAGHYVIQKDVNLEMYDWFFSVDFGRFISAKIPAQQEQLKKKSERSGLGNTEKVIQNALYNCTHERISELANKAETAKNIVRSNDFFDINKLDWALHVFHEVMDTISLAYAPARICMPPMETNLSYNVFISSELLKAVHDTQVNVYHDVYDHLLFPSLKDEQPDIIGISVVLKQQLLSALTFCSRIKEDFPRVHITLGGNTITRLRDILPEKPELFSLFDSAVLFEGETAFRILAESLDTDTGLSGVPNLIFRNSYGIHTSTITSAEDLTKSPPPDFDGLPLERYFVPERILPYLATRGCYWGRCKFCDHGEGYTAGYRSKKTNQIISDISYLSNRYQTRHFHFPDESYPPALFKKISKKLIQNNVDIAWMTHLRFEKGLIDEEIWKTVAEAGCKFLHLGFESGSERVLELMDKATTTDVISTMLEMSSNAGIWNHIMGFFGFPGEHYEDAHRTIQFLEENKDFIHSVGFGTFDLCKYAPVIKDTEKYGINSYQNPEWDLALDYYYTVNTGMGIEESERLLEEFEKDHYPGWDLRVFIREYLFLYTDHFDTNKIPSLRL